MSRRKPFSTTHRLVLGPDSSNTSRLHSAPFQCGQSTTALTSSCPPLRSIVPNRLRKAFPLILTAAAFALFRPPPPARVYRTGICSKSGDVSGPGWMSLRAAPLARVSRAAHCCPRRSGCRSKPPRVVCRYRCLSTAPASDSNPAFSPFPFPLGPFKQDAIHGHLRLRSAR